MTSLSDRVDRTLDVGRQTVAEPPRDTTPRTPPPPPKPRLHSRILDAVTDWIFTGKAR